MPRRPAVLLAVVCVCVGVWGSISTQKPPPLIVILLDGVRWDYVSIHRGNGLPGFERFFSQGAAAEYVNPAFPTNSFPNWHTIVTGLYPESHGIIGNYIYDREALKVFSIDDLEGAKDPAWWSDAEPFWITATKGGLQSALFLWSRCDVPWDGGVLPRHCDPFRFAAPNTDNMVQNFRQAVDMIQNQGYSLAMVYDGIIDTQGHYFGPASSEVAAAVRDTDAALQQLWKDLSDRNMIDNVNVVLVSDHGMAWTGQGKVRELDVVPCLEESQVEKVVEYGGYINVQPRAGYAMEVMESLRRCPTVGENVNVFLKKDVPEPLHYKAHRLILEIVVIAKEGYMIRPPQTAYSVPESAGSYEGNHGLDNTNGRNPDMRAVLYAVGPYFAPGVRAGVVEQVDVYNLLCRSVQLQCHANNGTLAHVEAFFRPGVPLQSSAISRGGIPLAALMAIVSALLLL